MGEKLNCGNSFKHCTMCRVCDISIGDVCCSLKVQGVLPSLVVPVSDKRLQEILVLVKSVPFPESDPAPEEDDVSNLGYVLLLILSSVIVFILFVP